MKVLLGSLVFLASAAAWAGVGPTPGGQIPEPGTLALLAAGAAAALGTHLKRRK